jgi:hypothetical protein
VSATDGTETSKVVITWTKSFGATGYKVYEGVNLLDTLGDVSTYDDVAAAAGIITAGTATASDGTSSLHVVLSLAGESVANGASRTYKVVAVNATGDSDASSTDTGYRGTGAITYQWQVSAGDSDASYGNIAGATTDPYNDTTGVETPDGRYYKCVLSATGAINQTSTADRGYKTGFVVPVVITQFNLGFGGTYAVLKGTITNQGDAGVTQIGFDYGLTTAYGSSKTITGTWITGNSFVLVVDNLSKATVYHYRAKAFNGAWGYGADYYVSTSGSPALYEYLNTGGDGDSDHIYGNNWASQYFTVGATSHTVTSIRVYIKRTLLPSTITISLKHATAGVPTGADIVSATLDGNAISTTYTWYEITFNETILEAGQTYAIVIRAVAGDTDNDVQWKKDDGGGLANSLAAWSTDGGITWAADGDNDDLLFEIWGNSCILVESAAVYKNYIKTGDMLFLVLYKNIYAPYYPASDPSLYFEIQLLAADGVTVLASTPCQQWEYMPASIYLNAQAASSLNDGEGYFLRIYGTFTGNPSAQYQLTTIDWLNDGLFYLKQWIMAKAGAMETWYTDYLGKTITLTAIKNNVYVLNQDGGTAFAIGIPSLITVFPQLFYDIDIVFNLVYTNPIDVYSSAELWSDLAGADLTAVATSLSTIFGGIDAKTVIGIMILIVYMVVVGVVVGRNTDNITLAMVLAFPFIAFAAYLRVIDIAAIAIIASIAFLLAVTTWYFQRQ